MSVGVAVKLTLHSRLESYDCDDYTEMESSVKILEGR